jgi:ribosomal protein S18 acetylase RimI-like enzyme
VSFEIALALRVCREQDLPALEWMGLYSAQRAVIRATFDQQQRGDGVMLLGIANDFPLAQAWLDFASRGSRQRPRVWALRVFPPLQGLGIGTWMLRAAEQFASSRAAREIEIGVERNNASALGLYQRLGYRLTGVEIDGVDQYLLTKAL